MGNYFILDAALCAILVSAFIIGCKRGFLRTVWSISALLIAIALTVILRPYAADMFESSALNSFISGNVSAEVSQSIENSSALPQSESSAEAISALYLLPEKYSRSISESLESAAEVTTGLITDSISTAVTAIAASVFLFIVIRFALALLYSVLKLIFSFPVLKQTNRLAGGIIQLILALALIYTILAAAAVAGAGIFEGTVLCKYMYEHNLLLALIGI